MKKCIGSAVLVLMLLAIGPRASAQDDTNFKEQLKSAQQHRLFIEAQMGIKAHENIYDVADHYMGDHMMHQVPEDLGVFIN